MKNGDAKLFVEGPIYPRLVEVIHHVAERTHGYQRLSANSSNMVKFFPSQLEWDLVVYANDWSATTVRFIHIAQAFCTSYLNQVFENCGVLWVVEAYVLCWTNYVASDVLCHAERI